jgi:hypothetical protein
VELPDSVRESILRDLMGDASYLASAAPSTMTTAATKSATTISATELLKGMEAAAASATVSAAPSWAATSLKWLRENGHGSYGGSGRTPAQRLAQALRRMSFDRAALEGAESRADYERRMDAMAASWSLDNHNAMRKFLETGGYAAEREAMSKEVITMPGSDEALEVVMNGGVLAPAKKTAPVAAPLTEEEELAAAVAAEEKARDPRRGSW